MGDSPIQSDPIQVRPPGRWHWFLLALIIAAAAALRFLWLDQPLLWGDEAATYRRAWGSYERLLSFLRNDGFVPLHHQLYWLLARVMDLSPWQMRLVPALMGVLFIPAIYSLARQITRPGTALMAAALAAGSAFLLAYSRDAKMYMATWTLLTFHAAAFLWWARTGRGLAWWCWVAAAALAAGFHSSVWLVLILEILFFATSDWPKKRRLLPLLLGFLLTAAGPAGYYLDFNQWITRSGGLAPGAVADNAGNWQRSGISWIGEQVRDKTAPQLVRDSAAAFTLGYSQAEEETRGDLASPVQPVVRQLAYGSLTALGIIALLGLFAPCSAAAATPAPLASWRQYLWLWAWLVVPTYGFFYCRSVPHFVSPLEWFVLLWHTFSWRLLWLAAFTVLLACAAAWQPRIRRLCLGLTIAILTLPPLAMAWQAGGDWYASWLRAFSAGLLPALAAAFAIAAAWAKAGPDARARSRVAARFLLASILLLLLCLGLYELWTFLAVRSQAMHPGVEWKPIWMPRYLGVIIPAVLITLAILLMRLWLPLRILAASLLLAANLAQYFARFLVPTEPPIEWMAADAVEGALHDTTLVCLLEPRGLIPSPGHASLSNATGWYYLERELKRRGVSAAAAPLAARISSTGDLLSLAREGRFPFRRPIAPQQFQRQLARLPQVQELIIWQITDLTPLAAPPDLGGSWQLISQWKSPIYRFWNWQFLGECGRYHFCRSIAP